MKIPFNDLTLNYQSIKSEVDAAVERVISSQKLIGGEEVDSFEQEFATYCGAESCVACSSGTDALYLALKALGIGPGDQVVVPSMTFVATAEAVSLLGATPVFADVEPGRATLSALTLQQAITPLTRAVIVVHLYGQIADMEPIASFCRANELPLIEDTAQAHGAELSGKKPGSWGDFAAYSFYPGKNLGAFGDAGALTGANGEKMEKARMLRDHGRTDKYLHRLKGHNGRCDALQAAVLRIKLRHLPEWTGKRRNIACRYIEELKPEKHFALPVVPEGSLPVWHLFTIRSECRDALRDYLSDKEISSGIHYPYALHQQPAFKEEAENCKCPESERIAATTLSLPIFPEMTAEQQEHVIQALNTWEG